MRRKILFLLTIIAFGCTSCTFSVTNSAITDPPVDNFVKIFKKLEVTRCLKAVPNKCETRIFFATGSGLIVHINPEYPTVLSAGHVCEEGSTIVPEDSKYKYSWNEELKLLDRNRNTHDAMIIISSQASAKSSDLCTLYSDSIRNLELSKKIEISPRPPRVGEDVYYIGAPVGIYHPPTALIVRGVFSGKIDNYSSLASTVAAPGASGSAILSLDNKIYGVLFAVHPKFLTATIITDYQETRKFIEKTRKLLKNNN